MQTDRLLTNVEAAEYLGISPDTLNQSRWSGINCPPYVKLGRSVRYRMPDLEAYVSARVKAAA